MAYRRRQSRIAFFESLESRRLLSTAVIDNDDPMGYAEFGSLANWNNQGFAGADGVRDVDELFPGAEHQQATWTFDGLAAGAYRVSATWTPYYNRATNATYRITQTVPPIDVPVNQKLSPSDPRAGGLGTSSSESGFAFADLAELEVRGGLLRVDLSDTPADGNVIADAVRIELLESLQDTVPPEVTAALARDTAFENTTDQDGVTFDPTMEGSTWDVGTGVSILEVQLDDTAWMCLAFDSQGAFTHVPALATDGSDDGSHVVRLRARDGAGNVSAVAEVAFTLDTTGPSPPQVDLATASDTPPLSDLQTTLDLVSLAGHTDPLTPVRLLELDLRTTSDGSGTFTFHGVPLNLGDNSLTVRVFDAADNRVEASMVVTRDADANTTLLAEAGRFLTEAAELVDLATPEGSRTLRIAVDADFDTSDAVPVLEDVFQIYLVDPDAPSDTLLDGGVPGTALFSLIGERSEFLPGRVRFDGNTVEIDVTSLGHLTEGLLVYRLLNSDSDEGSDVGCCPKAKLGKKMLNWCRRG